MNQIAGMLLNLAGKNVFYFSMFLNAEGKPFQHKDESLFLVKYVSDFNARKNNLRFKIIHHFIASDKKAVEALLTNVSKLP